jgi:hypothetical protein
MTYKAVLSIRRQLVVFAIAMIAYHLIFFAYAQIGTAPNTNVLAQLTLGGPAYLTALLAVACGANLSLERSETGRTSLLFPISRVRMALATFAVDGVGLTLAYAYACVLGIGVSLALHGPTFTLRGGSLLACIVLPLAAIAAFYGVVALVSVVVGHGRYSALAVAFVCILLFMFTDSDVPGYKIFAWLNIVNPLLYLSLASELVLGHVHKLDIYTRLSLKDIAKILGVIAVVSLTSANLIFRRARI